MPDYGDLLAGGAWETRGLVRVWVPREVPPSPPRRLNPGDLIACPTCRARLFQHCRTRSGRHRSAHATRLVSRRCPCGDPVAYGKKLCDECRAEARRINARIGMRNTRARRRAEREAA